MCGVSGSSQTSVEGAALRKEREARTSSAAWPTMSRIGTSAAATASVRGMGGAASVISPASAHMISPSRRWMRPLASAGR
jgi:hypothetical protein